MIQPLAAPIRPPTSSTSGTITQTLGKMAMPNIGSTIPLVISQPAIMPHSPSVAPIERSMPAVIITKVMPSARKALMAICFTIITRLPRARKSGTVIAKKPTIKNSAIKVRSFSSSRIMLSRELNAFAGWPAIVIALLPFMLRTPVRLLSPALTLPRRRAEYQP